MRFLDRVRANGSALVDPGLISASLRAIPASPGYPQYLGGGGGILPASPWADGGLTEINLEDVFGLQGDLLSVTRAEAMSVPAVAAARHRVCGTLARLPIRAYLGDTDTRWADEGHVPDLLDHPDPAEPQFQTMVKTYDDVFFQGSAFWAVTAQRGGRPTQVVHVPFAYVQTVDDYPQVDSYFTERLGRLLGRVLLNDPHIPPPVPGINRGEIPAHPWLLWFQGPHTGLLNFGARTIRSSVGMDKAAGRAADNPVPSIELHQTNDADMSDADIRKMIGNWMAARRGENGGVGYTSAGVEARALGQQPEQLLIQGRNQQAVEVARLAGIPAASIDASLPGTALTYANLLDRLRDLVDFGLQPYATAVTGRLSTGECFPSHVRARVDFSPLVTSSAAAAATPTQTPTTEGPKT